jgi:hypothetical protein
LRVFLKIACSRALSGLTPHLHPTGGPEKIPCNAMQHSILGQRPTWNAVQHFRRSPTGDGVQRFRGSTCPTFNVVHYSTGGHAGRGCRRAMVFGKPPHLKLCATLSACKTPHVQRCAAPAGPQLRRRRVRLQSLWYLTPCWLSTFRQGAASHSYYRSTADQYGLLRVSSFFRSGIFIGGVSTCRRAWQFAVNALDSPTLRYLFEGYLECWYVDPNAAETTR